MDRDALAVQSPKRVAALLSSGGTWSPKRGETTTCDDVASDGDMTGDFNALDNVAIEPYGTGADPILDASKAVSTGDMVYTGSDDVYYFEVTAHEAGGYRGIIEDGEFLPRYSSLANLQAASAGGSYTTPEGNGAWTAGSTTVRTYFKASDASNPTSNGKAYRTHWDTAPIRLTGSGWTGGALTLRYGTAHNGLQMAGGGSVSGIRSIGFIGHGGVLGVSTFDRMHMQSPASGNVTFLTDPVDGDGVFHFKNSVIDCRRLGNETGKAIQSHANTMRKVIFENCVLLNPTGVFDTGCIEKMLICGCTVLDASPTTGSYGVVNVDGTYGFDGVQGKINIDVIDSRFFGEAADDSNGTFLKLASIAAGAKIRMRGVLAYGFGMLIQYATGGSPTQLVEIDMEHCSFLTVDPDRADHMYGFESRDNFKVRQKRCVLIAPSTVSSGRGFGCWKTGADYDVDHNIYSLNMFTYNTTYGTTFANWQQNTGQDANSHLVQTPTVTRHENDVIFGCPEIDEERAGHTYYLDNATEIGRILKSHGLDVAHRNVRHALVRPPVSDSI